MRDYFKTGEPIHFVFPIDGDCLNIYDGSMKKGYLTIPVKVEAPDDADIYINEEKAEFDGKYYVLEVALKSYRNVISACNKKDGYETDIAVYKLEDCVDRYRISLDDNILFLADLTKNKDVYQSMFENPYLRIFKEAHDLYGAKIHINIYYEYCDKEEDRNTFSAPRPYFNLTMMTDRFKEEWKANADWLKLSFHARSNHPNAPYKYATMKQVEEDIDLVHREITRFAGAESLSPVTTLHFGDTTRGGARALRNRGYRGQNAFIRKDDSGVNYYPEQLVKYELGRDFWVDNETHIVHSNVDLILNCYKLEEIVPLLEEIYKDKHRAGFLELLIHEQYFYPDYSRYIPEYAQIVLTAAKWAAEHGYRGALMSEVMFEKLRSNDLPQY